MHQNVDSLIKKVTEDCFMYFNDSENERKFSKLYPFTTENISGYIDLFDLKNKSLLTVGSSADQVINAYLKGCNDITLLDINRFCKYYYFLKISGIISLSKSEFLEFFRYSSYPKEFENNSKVFDRKIFNKLKDTLRIIDYESYLFWDELFHTMDGTYVRKRLFSTDEDRTYMIEKMNPYLKDSLSYDEVKDKLKRKTPRFLCKDVTLTSFDESYDNIWLSNIGAYLSMRDFNFLVDRCYSALNKYGKLLACYLYSTDKDTEYNKEWAPVYNLKNVFSILKRFNPQLITFQGVNGIKFDNKTTDAMVLIKK